jgi:hypothetical protein
LNTLVLLVVIFVGIPNLMMIHSPKNSITSLWVALYLNPCCKIICHDNPSKTIARVSMKFSNKINPPLLKCASTTTSYKENHTTFVFLQKYDKAGMT